MKRYLPIGSVVTLAGGSKPVMIYGRLQMQEGSEEIWDYVGCLYPEGNLGDDYTVFFQHEQIGQIWFVGYDSEEERQLQAQLRKYA